MQGLCQGQVVDLEILDPRGQNLKQRPVVIVNVNEALEELIYVAISTQLADPLPDGWILLPWSSDGRARTGLIEPCAAKANWIGMAKLKNVARIRGHLPTAVMLDIMRAVKKN